MPGSVRRSAFGGPCQTPAAEKLAASGLKFNRFHTTALCSPTRQALLTGRNHHSVGMGGITEIATGAPGYCSVLPNTMSPLARTLKFNGYTTAQFGKCHEVPVWETSPVGPFDRGRPVAAASSTSTASSAAKRNQWYPTLYEGTTSDRGAEDAGRGLPPDGGHDRQGHRLDRPAEGARARTSRSSSISRPAPPTRRTTCPRSGPTSTRASSTRAGTSCARRPSPARRSWA